jgi:hypothetical protein
VRTGDRLSPRRTGDRLPSVRTTVALRDELVRCYAVARGYERLSQALARHVLGSTDTNWATWAMWATRSVAHTLDESETPLALAQLLDHVRAPRWIRRGVHDVYLWASVRINEQQRIGLSRGNTDVYSQIGHDLSRFVDLYRHGRPTDAELEAFLGTIQAPPARPDLAARLGDLRQGLRCYHLASPPELDATERAQLVLAGNLFIASYEQVQLQPYLDLVLFLAPTEPPTVRNMAREHLGPVVAHLMTRFLVNVSFPDRVVWTAQGVPRRPDGELFPPALRTLEHPLAVQAFREWDRAEGIPARTAVGDWSDLGERMNFAVNILRSLQQEPTLFDSPFPAELQHALDDVLARGRLTARRVAEIHQLARARPPAPSHAVR